MPVWATVAAAYRSVFGEGSGFVVRSAAWFGILVLANLLGFVLPGPAGAIIADVVGIGAALAAYVSLGVAWHRGVVLGEGPRSAGEAVRFGPREWRFLAATILAMLLAVAPVVLVNLAVPVATGAGASGAYLMAISAAAAWALFLTARFSLAFPLVAIDATSAPLRASWQMTQRGWLRLVGALLVAALPLVIAAQLLLLLTSRMTSMVGLLLIMLLLGALSLLQVAVMSTLASHAYLHISGRTPGRPAA